MNPVLERVGSFLKEMNVEYLYDESEDVIVVPFRVGSRVYAVIVAVMGDWLLTVSRVAGLEDLPESASREGFLARLLRDTFYLNEVTYGLTDNGDVVVHACTNLETLTFEGFRDEFYSVVAGVHHFVEEVEPEFWGSKKE